MKRITLFIALCLFVSSLNIANEREINGKWVGISKREDNRRPQPHVPLEIAIDVHGDNTVTGTVGNAEITNGRLTKGGGWNYYRIKGNLKSKIFRNKDWIAIHLSKPYGDKMKCNCFLKSNFIFDISMKQEVITLSRTQ